MDDIIGSQDADDRFLGFAMFRHEHHREFFAFLVEIVIKRGSLLFRREAGKEGVMLADVLLDGKVTLDFLQAKPFVENAATA